jgi:predicted porin
MKKHIIAAAVSAAFAVPAVAQVTISGNIEAGYVSSTSTAKVRTSTAGTMVGTPTITISGSEDLGGGLKASFKLSQEWVSMNGAEAGGADSQGGLSVSPTKETNSAQFEESSVTVSGGFGAIKLGRFSHAVRDNFGNYRFFGDIGRVDSDFRTLNKEVSNSVQFSTPSIAGVTAHVAYGNFGVKTAAEKTPAVTSGGVQYKAGAFNVGAGWTSYDTSETVKGITKTVGGSYNFGVAKVGYLYADYRDAGTSRVDQKANVFQIAAPVGKGLNVGASYHKYDEATSNGGVAYSLVVSQALSKRTAVYAAYVNAKNDGTGGYGQAAIVAPGSSAGSQNGMGVSVVHKF